MKRFFGRGLFLAALILPFSQTSVATESGRTDKAGPWEDGVEVIAGTGYAHTLFDSADNKCQHCHNDLYDTWKTSMHAKSWKDPLFQAKYQDFLRLQASKIGATGPTGTYSAGTIQKSGKVCIKCHAPTAFYSNDYQITVTPATTFADAKAAESNLSSPPASVFDPAVTATVASMALNGQAYTVSYHIGHKHNREGINCAFCHSMETVRLFSDTDGDDLGQYTLTNPIKMGPIGPVVHLAGDTLDYSPAAHDPDMNAFFALIGPELYFDVANTPDAAGEFDLGKKADGRYTMKSIPTGCNDPGDADGDGDEQCHYTGGPFYGPFGVTGLSNSREDDVTDRTTLVKAGFQAAVDAEHGDKFTSKHQFAAYGKALCLSCHQRSSLMLNPEFNGVPGVQTDPSGQFDTEDQFLELCSTWTAMSDGVGDNYQDTKTAPKCQRCHMEPLAGKTVLHKWDNPDELFTVDDGVTEHFDPESGVGPVAEGYLNNHAFMGANTADFGLVKIKSGFSANMEAESGRRNIVVKTFLNNETAHMFPGAHPMRRVLTRLVVTDANGNKLPFTRASGRSKFTTVTNHLATLEGDTIMPGFETVKVRYDKDREIVIQGQTPNLDAKGELVKSQYMDNTVVSWTSPDATVFECGNPNARATPSDDDGDGVWKFEGCTTVKKITDIDGATDHFTRIYGRETGKRAADGTTHVVRPGFDSNIATDNRLEPNEKEKYKVYFRKKDVTAWPVTVKYKVYYLKKGGSGKFPTGPDGFYESSSAAQDPVKKKKLAIFNVYEKEVSLEQ